MYSIIIASVPIQGHVGPLLQVASELVQRGCRVRFLTGGRFASAVAATGARFVPLPADADFDDRQDIEQRLPERQALRGTKALAFDIEHIFVRPARSQFRALEAELAHLPADAVLAEPAFAGAAFLLGRRRASRPPVIVCGVLPLSLASRDTAPYGLGLAPAPCMNPLRNALLQRLVAPVFERATQVADIQYREVHGRAMPFQVLDWMRHADGIVQFTVPAFEYPRSDPPPMLHFAGPLGARGSTAPLPPWWDDLPLDRPWVHVTQGTFANKDYDQLITPTLRALADEPVIVVVSTGGRPLDTLPTLPPNARAAEYLPYDALLPRTRVFVTNGGYGGVHYALRHGVPIVATGGKEDKPEVGARVAWSGVGVRIRSEHPSPRALRRAVRTVLGDARFREASQRMADDMASSPGMRCIVEMIARLALRDASTIVDVSALHPGIRAATPLAAVRDAVRASQPL